MPRGSEAWSRWCWLVAPSMATWPRCWKRGVRRATSGFFARPQHQLHAHVVDDSVLELDVLVARRDLACDREEQAVGVLHDVGLVHGGHLMAVVAARVVEGKLDDSLRAADGDRLDRKPAVRADLFLKQT